MLKVKDMFWAAFLDQKGYETVDFEKISGTDRAYYLFDLSEEEAKKLKLEFAKTDIVKNKNSQKKLIDLVRN